MAAEPRTLITDLFAKSCQVNFVTSVFSNTRLPPPELPEIAFAGRSNVGKSSLINRLINRRGLVKVSSRPGKTQSLNYFLAAEQLYLVDLPGYGFARVPKRVKNDWSGLISSYIENRETLRCVVVIIDIRHPPKDLDRELIDWLNYVGAPSLMVYTKADKLSRNQVHKNSRLLDAGFNIEAGRRVVFSAKTGRGLPELLAALDSFCHNS